MSSSGNGVLYPIYMKSGGNVPYVQEMDKSGNITDFIEFLDLENFNIYYCEEVYQRSIASNCLFAIMVGSVLQVFDFSEANKLIRYGELKDKFDELPPLTRLGLSRIAALPNSSHLEIHQQYLDSCKLKSNISAMRKAEIRLVSSQGKWWEGVFEREFGHSEDVSSLHKADREEIINWLFENDVSLSWKIVVEKLLRRVLFDERISDLLFKFVSSMDDMEEYDSTAKQIVGRGLELYIRNPKYGGDFEDVMIDKIFDGTFFYLGTSLSAAVMEEFLFILIKGKEEVGEHFALIDSLIDYLDSDVIIPRIVNVIMNVLFEFDLTEYYGDKSFYEGLNRIERLVEAFKEAPSVGLYLREGDVRSYLQAAANNG
ncbi:hypothetical protein GGQ88_002069 [Novosphingobium hassiacum]|uniref:Uncharacterized protein n=1 Tax=Novosphingobium hassiacum TaxID=173676 RepID=A0A7W5ZVN1_9SPHN|nr:hypothetical protein [Novosphingobium hassiacum]MBB3860800.1 hypothetical protein [Novosphingobium hassiacum]